MKSPSRFTGKLAMAALAAITAPLLTAAPEASAGDTRFSVHVDHGHSSYGHRASGYYKSVWHPPVYRTRYDDCGRSYRVCVRAGYYAKVWVATRHHRDSYRDHGSYDHRPKYRSDRYRSNDYGHKSRKRYDRSGRWDRWDRRSCR